MGGVQGRGACRGMKTHTGHALRSRRLACVGSGKILFRQPLASSAPVQTSRQRQDNEEMQATGNGRQAPFCVARAHANGGNMREWGKAL